ncbi:MAG: DUF2169 domain-containing protein, partial [Sandaracinaceae bacterium]|nr:DUF2169 domain-containing protein [Sandaracinaceae bacterium]
MSRLVLHPDLDAVVDVHPLDRRPQRVWATVKKTYWITERGLVPAPPEPLRHDIRDDKLAPRWPPGSDFWPFKPAADVVVLGKAFAPGGQPVEQRRVCLRVGSVRKTVQVWGRRLVEWTSGGLPRFGAPEPFREIELSYANAYGGVDPRVPSRAPRSHMELISAPFDHPGFYPRNGSGKGYLIHDGRVDGVELPNLEDPDALLTPETLLVRDPAAWYRQPMSWSLDWQYPAMFPRSHYLGVVLRHPIPDAESPEEARRGLIPETWRSLRGALLREGKLSPLYFQEASVGMSFRDLREGTPIEVEGMHPEHERLGFGLPPFPRMSVDVEGAREVLSPRVLHVVVRPHERKVEVTWAAVATQPVHRAFFPEIHGRIPILLDVDGRAVPHESPEPIYDTVRHARSEGLVDMPAPRRVGEGSDLGAAMLTTEAPCLDRDQASWSSVPCVAGVDPTTGRVLVQEQDFAAGPLLFSRRYSSSMGWRVGSLGPGWSHCLEQYVWEQQGWVMVQLEDGRVMGAPVRGGGGLALGADVHHARAGWTVRRIASDAYELQPATGGSRVFRPDSLNGSARFVLARWLRIDGAAIDIDYDLHGRPAEVKTIAGPLARLEHDAQGRLTRVFVPVGSEWAVACRYEHDSQGRLTEVVDGMGRASRYGYDGRLLVSETTRAGRTRRHRYDGRGPQARCVAIEEGTQERTFAFDPTRRVCGVTDALGHSASYRIDEQHRIVRELDVFASERTCEWDSATGLLSREALADGTAWRRYYDPALHLALLEGPTGTSTTFEHDARGRPIARGAPDGTSWRLGWDAEGRLGAVALPDGTSAIFEHDPHGLRRVLVPGDVGVEVERDVKGDVCAVKSRLGARHARCDALGRVIEVLDEGGHSVRYHYDPCGHIDSIELPTGERLAIARDPTGHVTAIRMGPSRWELERDAQARLGYVGAEGVGSRLHRDAEGRVVLVEDERGALTELQLDGAGRLRKELGPDGVQSYILRDSQGRIARQRTGPCEVEVERDPCGRIVALRAASGSELKRFEHAPSGRLRAAREGDLVVSIEHDGLGRVRSETEIAEIRSTYDVRGHRVSWSSSLGLRVRIDRDERGGARRIEARLGEARLVLELERDARGDEVLRRMAGNVEARWARDAMGRPTQRVLLQQGAEIGRLDLAWEGVDRVSWRSEGYSGRQFAVAYRRDARGRVVGAYAGIREVAARHLDPAGNLAEDGSRHEPSGRVLERGGAQYSYDAAGRRTEKRAFDDTSTRYVWDGLGRLQSVELPEGKRIRFTYDALDRRTRRAVEIRADEGWRLVRETRYVWDGSELLHEIEGDRVVTWLWEAGELVGKLEGGHAYAVLLDAAGAPTELIADDGRVAWRGAIDLFGNVALSTHDTDCPWRFAGHYEDPDTGLLHALWRALDTETGAYLSRNPLGFAAGPNLYAYGIDPVSERSPLGLGPGLNAWWGEVAPEGLDAERVELALAAWDRADAILGPPRAHETW